MVTFGSPSSGAHGSPDPFNGVYSSLPGHGRTPQPPYSTGRRLSTPKLNRESPPTNNVTTSPGYYTFTSPTATVSFHHHEAGIGAPELQEKRPFRCLYCVSAFTTKDHLENHLKKLHLRDEDKQYNCHHCGKAFWSEDHLRQHDRWSRTCEIAKTTVEDSESNADASSSPRARNAQGLGVIEKTSSKRNQNDCSTPLNQPPTLSHPTQGKVTEGSFSRTVSTRENVIVEEIEEPNTLLSGRRSESQGARGTTSQALGTSNTTANSTPRLQGVLLSSAADHPENPQLSVSMHDDETFDSNSSTCVPPSVETYNNECPEKDRADDSNRHGEDTKGIKETASKEEADDDFWGFTTSKKTKKKKNKKKSDSSRPGSPATFGLSLEVNEPSGPSPGHAIGSQGSGWEDGSRWSFQTSPSKPVKTNNDDDIWGWGTTFSKKATSTSKNLSQSSTNHAGSEFVSPMVKPECRNTDTAKMVAHLDGKDAQTRQEHKSNLRADNCRGLPSLVDPMEIDEPDSQVSLLISERMEVDAQLKTEPRNKAPAENFRSSSSKREQTWGLTTSPFHPYHARVSTYNDHYSDTTQPRPHARAHTQSSFRDYCAQYTSQYSPDAFSPRYAVTGQYATASVRPSSPYRESERPKRPRRHGKSSYSYYLALGYDDPDEDEYIEVNGQTYVIPSAKRTRRHAAYEPAISRSRSDSSYNPYAPGDYESDSRHNRLSTINRRKSSAVPERSRTVRPSEARPKAPTAPIKATEADARKYKIPAGYSLKNWDPVQEPILLLGSVFDGNSLGKWIYDWTVHCHGSSSPLAEISGELWLLLIQLTGKIKRLDETIPTIRSREKRELCEEFADSGERLVDKLKSLLKNCEAPMLKAAKDRKGSQLGRNSGVEFIETLFGRDRELEKTERLMQSVRL
ncbi:hypothetical protein F5Y16DRAFT_123173 [Xylariaceae sp. FL0255]|nr:hypothetical protein F5Y16DRAFT_123173 [Xylariaceae sp. FL0255]